MQIAINGLSNGMTIALLALAFTIVYLPTRIFHMALAGVYAIVPFIAWAGLHSGMHQSAAIAAALLAGVVLSLACEVLNHRLLEKKLASPAIHLVSSLGINIVMVQSIVMIWGTQPKVLRVGLDDVVQIGDVILTGSQIVALCVAFLLLAGFYVWLQFSNLGLRFRALADNPVEMALRGHNVGWLRLVAFGLSGLFAGTASLCVGFDSGFSPHGGLNALILAVVAMIVGGRHSFIGPLAGGLILGLVRSEVAWFLSSRWQEAITFLLLAGFLLLCPGGLLRFRRRLEADA